MLNFKDDEPRKSFNQSGSGNEEKLIEVPQSPDILVVEDERSLLKLISSILTSNGFTSDKASSIREAMATLSRKVYDIVFLDLGLPDGSGFSILESIVESSPETIVTVITGIHDLETAIKAIRKGAYDYITKPFSVLLFQERLNNLIDEWKSKTFISYYQRYLEKLVEEKIEELKITEYRMEKAYDMTVYALGTALDLRYPETEEHCRRVAENAVHLAKNVGVTGQSLRDLKWGSYLHDIGKIGIPENILKKEGQLTNEEMSVIKKHSLLGYNMLKNIDFLKGAGEVVLYHHEKYDGSGYPLGLCEKQIPLLARIFAVVDAYDAMVFDRPYRKALSTEKAKQELIRCKGTHFDPDLVDAFFELPQIMLKTG